MDFDVFVYRDESGAYVARVPGLRGVHSWGTTPDEAVEHVRDAIALALEDDGPPTWERVGVRTVHVEA